MKLLPENRWVLFKLGTMVLILILLGRYIVNHLNDFAAIRNIGLRDTLILVVLQMILIFTGAAQFHVVVKMFGCLIAYPRWLLIYVHARLLNLLVPQSGNAYRATALKINHQFSITAYGVALITFSYLNSLTALILTWLTVLLVDINLRIRGELLVEWLGLAVIGAIIVSALMVRCQAMMAERWGAENGKLVTLARVLKDLSFSLRGLKCVSQVFLIGLIGHILGLFMNWFCFVKLNVDVPISHLALLRFAKNVTDSISITPGNFGVRESMYAIINSETNGLVSAGIIVAAWSSIVSIVASIVLGLLSFLFNSKKTAV
ncbi:MAG: flippase-like domain-containing protein [Deltaproteobacteria bacterium]|nr:flippase-like domain-containing protein [Deltaproteobacteria bacterium]